MEVNLDSLFQRIAEEPQGPGRIPLLHNAIMVALHRDPHRALAAAEEVLHLSERAGDRWALGMSWLLMGRVLIILARYADGLIASDKAHVIFREHGDRLNSANALSDSGSALINLGDYAKAFDLLTRSLALAEEIHSDSATVYSLNRLGYLWQRLENQSQAMLYWQRALVIAERLGSEELQSTISNNIASICVELGELGRAREYYERNLAKAVARKDLYREALSRVNIAEVSQLESRFDEALQHQSRALQLFRTLRHSHFEGILLSNMGRIFEKKGDLALSLQHQLEAVRLLGQSSDKQDAVRVQLRLGVLYRRMGESRRGIELLLEAGKMAAEIGSEQLQGKVSKQLALSYEQQGDYAAALVEYRRYMTLRRAFLQTNNRRATERLRLRSEVEGASREKEIQRIRNTELAAALEQVRALSAHYQSMNMQNSLLVESVSQKLHLPLAEISKTTERMSSALSAGDSSPLQGFLDEMERSARKASRTVDMLLLAHALEAGKFVPEPERFDVAGLAGKVLEDFRNKAAFRQISLQLYAGERCLVTADSGAVKQILNALVSNAILYSPQGSEVSIHLSVQDGTAVVRISDSGPGLRRDGIRRLNIADHATGARSFQPGSGLYLARIFTAAVHGTLRYERKKKRTNLVLEFPAEVPPAGE